MKYGLMIILCGVLMASCAPMTATRGNFLESEDVNRIQPMVSTDYDVLNILGTPTAKAVFDDNTWYYVGLKTEKKSFFDEKVTERKIYQVKFDETKFVQSITELGEDPIDIPIASRTTPTSGNEVTALQQILGNIGKFNPPKD